MNKTLTEILAVMVLAVLSAVSGAEEQTLLIQNTTLIDGTGSPPMPATDILIKGNRILSVKQSSGNIKADVVVNGQGKFVMPGIIDAHTHLHFPVVFQKTEEEKEQIVEHTPLAFLYNGVTTVLNLGSDAEWIWALRDRQRAGRLVAPRIYAAGHGFTPEDGWGSRHGATPEDPELVRKKVLHYHEERSDGLKIIIEDGLGEGSGLFREMPEPMLQAIVSTAREHDMKMYIHAIGLPEYRRAVTVRPHAIVHGLEDRLPDGDPLFDDLANHRIFVVPTISLFESFNGPDPHAGKNLDHPVIVGSVPAFLLENMRRPEYMRGERERFSEVAQFRVYKWARERVPLFCENIRKMHEAGVELGVGTDAGGTVGYNYQGYNTPWELKIFTQCGLSPMEALVAATRNGAAIIGVEDELGTVEPGKLADLLILSASPLDDIENVRRIDWVMQNGTLHRRDDFAYRQ